MSGGYDFDVIVVGAGHAGAEAAMRGRPTRCADRASDHQLRYRRADEL